MSNLLTICQNASDEIGIDRPTSVIGNSDPNVRMLLRFCNVEGEDLAKSDQDWTVLNRLHTFTTTDGTEEYSLPSDFGHLLRNTEWDRTNYYPLIGPLTPEQWQVLKSGAVSSGIYGRRYRILRSATTTSRTLRVDPVPTTTGDTLAFEYISSEWCSNAAGDTTYTEWNADTDVPLLDRRLLELGAAVRFLRGRGLDFASQADEYQQILDRESGQDRPSPNLNLVPGGGPRLIGPYSIPETGYGS